MLKKLEWNIHDQKLKGLSLVNIYKKCHSASMGNVVQNHLKEKKIEQQPQK